ncbi:MAG: hypothetical protein LLF94_05545 [Chlamydiales bacterium]|nr:hypothetical protein [Chlamydiales bacterium]
MTSPIDKSPGFQGKVPEPKADDISNLSKQHASALPEALGERDETMEILHELRGELYGDRIDKLVGLNAQDIPAAVKKLKPQERAELRKLLPTLSKPTGDDKWHITTQREQIGYALRELEYADKKSSERAQKFEQIKARATNASRTVRAGVSNSMLGQKIKEGFRNLPAVIGGFLAKASAFFSTKTEEPRRNSGYEAPSEPDSISEEPSEKISSEVEDTAVEDTSSEVYSGVSQTENDDPETSSDTTEIELPSTRARIPPTIMDNSVQDLRNLDRDTLISYASHQKPEKANFIQFLVESKGESLDTIKKLSTMWLDEEQSALINNATDDTQMLQALQKIWSSLP